MYAVVEAGGRQYQLTSGRYVDVEMVSGEPQAEFVFDKVLMIVDGDNSMVGKPMVAGAKVVGKVIGHGRSNKLVVFKYRAKKGTRKRTGHKQHYTRIFIDSINLEGKVLSEAKDDFKPSVRKEVSKEPKTEASAEPKKASAKAAPATTKADAPKKAAPKKDAPAASAEPTKAAKKATKKEDK